MRLYSFHPKYLDNVGLSRQINEGVLGLKALSGQQKMWQNHPQLDRFKKMTGLHPQKTYQLYMLPVIHEWRIRKLAGISVMLPEPKPTPKLMNVTIEQIKYEWIHYINKLCSQKNRDLELGKRLNLIPVPDPHPLFEIIDGEIEQWEKIKS